MQHIGKRVAEIEQNIKLTLDLSQRLGWKQIDAVQLVGASE